MRTLFLTFICCAVNSLAIAQTNISGVINAYTNVVSIVNSGCTDCSNPACYDDVNVGSSASFSAGDKVLIMQMQGVEIDENNTSAFGDVLNMNNTGNFEFANVIAIPNGSTVRVEPLAQTYSTVFSSPVGITQLIRVPVYSGDVNVSATLTAQAWNGSTGGVLAFITDGDVYLNADIDVSGLGFRGGTADYLVTADASDCPFTTGNWALGDPNFGALKGEGTALFVTNKERARGNQVNGGGGGTTHNGGGGGGSNVGAGGGGGGSYCNCSNAESIAGRGEPGAALAPDANTVFMGGAGGAGHNNSNPGGGDPGTAGVNGGGIIMIKADEIINTNNSPSTTTVGPTINGSGFNASGTDWEYEIEVKCELTINSVEVRQAWASGAQVTVDIKRLDQGGTVPVVCSAGPYTITAQNTNETMPICCTLSPGRYYFNVNATSAIYMQAGGAYPYFTPALDILQPRYTNNPADIPNAFNWNISSPCAGGAYNIDASGLDQIAGTNGEGGGGGGAGGTIFLDVNGYQGSVNILANGGNGGWAGEGGCCHAPGGGAGGGYVCSNVAFPANVSVGVAGGNPGEALAQTTSLAAQQYPAGRASDFTGGCDNLPYNNYETYRALPGEDGTTCTGISLGTNCTLPVELVWFKGKKQDEINLLTWATSSEKNNDYFIVERSSDGVNFSSIGQVDGNNTTNLASNYNFVDTKPINGMSYYRLKQVDTDGSFSYSNIISIINEKIAVTLAPNPSEGWFDITVSGNESDYLVTLTDVNGRIVYTEAAPNNSTLHVNNISSGLYVLKVSTKTNSTIKKVIVY